MPLHEHLFGQAYAPALLRARHEAVKGLRRLRWALAGWAFAAGASFRGA
jgi:hypothetical protein